MDPADRALVELLSVAVDGGVAPALDPAVVRKHDLGPLAFRRGLLAFRPDFALSSIRAEQQRAVAREAVDALTSAGIPVALMKGIAYAGWLYDDPAERPMTDVDLLVPQAAHAAAYRELHRLGYRHAGPRVQLSELHHAMTLKRDTSAVDVHPRTGQIGRVAIDWDGLWRRSSDAPWIPGARLLAPVDAALFHFLHVARQDLIVPLLAFVDAGRLLRRVPEDELLARARAWRFARVLDACLRLVRDVLGWPPSAGPRWWLPNPRDVLAGRRPHRWVQIGRKVLLVEGPHEMLRMGLGVIDGMLR